MKKSQLAGSSDYGVDPKSANLDSVTYTQAGWVILHDTVDNLQSVEVLDAFPGEQADILAAMDTLDTSGDLAAFQGTYFTEGYDFAAGETGDDGGSGDNVQGTASANGVDAIFDIGTSTGTTYDLVTVVDGGSTYLAGETVLVLGSELNGVDTTNDATVTVTTVDTLEDFAALAADTETTTNGSGALIDIQRNAGAYSITGIDTAGTLYAVGDQLDYLGTSLNGATTANDLTLDIDQVDDTVAYNNLTTEITGGTGSGLEINVVAFDGGYTVTVVQEGTGYLASDDLVILGTDLGGASPANDLTIDLTSVGGGGEVRQADVDAAAVTGTAVAGEGPILAVSINGSPTASLVGPITAATVAGTSVGVGGVRGAIIDGAHYDKVEP